MRKLVIETNGAAINVSKCEVSLLEFKALLELLSEGVSAGKFTGAELEVKENAKS